MKNQFEYINNYYGLNVKKGIKLNYQGQPATVIRAEGQYLLIKIQGIAGARRIHPTWEVEYLD